MKRNPLYLYMTKGSDPLKKKKETKRKRLNKMRNMNELLNRIQVELEGQVWRPNYLYEVDSDPRYRALDLINEKLNKEIVWGWKNTDYEQINGEPIVVECSNTGDDKYNFKQALNKVRNIVNDNQQIIVGKNLIVILNI